MEKEIRKIKLPEYEVEIYTYLTWGEKEEITNILIKGAKIGTNGLQEYDSNVLLESKYKLLEFAIKKIINSDGKEIKFTKEWINNLSAEDGDLIYDAVDELSKKKEKKTIA